MRKKIKKLHFRCVLNIALLLFMLARHNILIKVLTTNINQTLLEKKRIFSHIFYSKLAFFYFLENFILFATILLLLFVLLFFRKILVTFTSSFEAFLLVRFSYWIFRNFYAWKKDMKKLMLENCLRLFIMLLLSSVFMWFA